MLKINAINVKKPQVFNYSHSLIKLPLVLSRSLLYQYKLHIAMVTTPENNNRNMTINIHVIIGSRLTPMVDKSRHVNPQMATLL